MNSISASGILIMYILESNILQLPKFVIRNAYKAAVVNKREALRAIVLTNNVLKLL